MKKRKPSFLLILVHFTTEKLLALFLAIISAGLGFEQWKKGVSMLQAWFWWVSAIFLLILIVSGAVREYQRELESYNSQSKPLYENGNRYEKSPHTEGGHIGDIIYGNKIVDAKKETEKKHTPDINLEKLRLAEGGFINYPESKYHNVTIEEHTFTVINETGQDLKKCFVLLDEFWVKEDWQTKGQWRLEAKDIFDKPFRWAKPNLPVNGKIDIDSNDKASFVLVELNRSSVLNVTENRNEPYLDFNLAMIGTEENPHVLYTGWENRLIITIWAKDSSNKDLSVKYSVYLRPHNAKGLTDIKVVREKQ
jgi:hypothetical protein